MKVAGFTFIRNAVKNDYPIVEAITSILPICDEFVVAVGNSDDETEQLIKGINSPKIKIIVFFCKINTMGNIKRISTSCIYHIISSYIFNSADDCHFSI